MFKNYLLTAWRNIKKNKGFFALNFIGLYISVVACILIGLIILHETSFDKSAGNDTNIYRIVKAVERPTGKTYTPITPYPLATALRAALPDEKLISQVHFQSDVPVFFDNKKLRETNIVFCRFCFPQTFSVNRARG